MNIPLTRDANREPCCLRASIDPGAGEEALGATVRNISINGARLEGGDVIRAPNQFDLAIEHATGDVERRRVRVVWRIGSAMGVYFTDGRSLGR